MSAVILSPITIYWNISVRFFFSQQARQEYREEEGTGEKTGI